MPRIVCGARRVEAQRCFHTPVESADRVVVRIPIEAGAVASDGGAGGPLPHGEQDQNHLAAGTEADAAPGSECGVGAVEGDDRQHKASAAPAGACDTADSLSGYCGSAGGLEGQRAVLRTAAEAARPVAAVEFDATAFPHNGCVDGELGGGRQEQGPADAGDGANEKAGGKRGI